MDENVKYFIAGTVFAVTVIKVLAKILGDAKKK